MRRGLGLVVAVPSWPQAPGPLRRPVFQLAGGSRPRSTLWTGKPPASSCGEPGAGGTWCGICSRGAATAALVTSGTKTPGSRWTGTDASGRPVEFFVRAQGRYIYSLRAPGPYPVRCSDGSVNSAPVGILAAWIDVDGTVRLPWFPGDPPAEGVTLDAKLSGTSAAGKR